MPVSQWVMLDCLLAWHSAYSTDSATEILNTSEICLRTEVQYLGNAAWYRVGVNRWPIGNHPSFMLYRLAMSPLTQRDWKVKDRFGLVRSANSAQAQSLLYCACTLPCHGRHHEKVGGGTVKKFYRRCAPEFVPHFWNASSATGHSQSKLWPPVKIWQIQPWASVPNDVKHCRKFQSPE